MWHCLKCFLIFFFIQGKSHGYSLFIKGRYQAARRALPLINLCSFSVCFLLTSMSLVVPCFQAGSKTFGAITIRLLLFSFLYPFPCFFSSMTTLYSPTVIAYIYRIATVNAISPSWFLVLQDGDFPVSPSRAYYSLCVHYSFTFINVFFHMCILTGQHTFTSRSSLILFFENWC